MARKYTKEELKERLQRSIYKVVAEEGIEGVTVRKVSKGCGLSDPYIYQCYKDLFDLMDPEVIVSNIIDSTVSVAVKMHLGYMDKTALKARTIYKTVFALLFQLLHIDVWNGEYKSSERLLFVLFRVHFLDVKKYKTTTC